MQEYNYRASLRHCLLQDESPFLGPSGFRGNNRNTDPAPASRRATRPVPIRLGEKLPLAPTFESSPTGCG